MYNRLNVPPLEVIDELRAKKGVVNGLTKK